MLQNKDYLMSKYLEYLPHNEVLGFNRPSYYPLKTALDDVFKAHIDRHRSLPWSIMVIDGTDFMECVWAIDRTTLTQRKYGIVRDQTLKGLADKFRVALNTLVIFELMPFTPKEVFEAAHNLSDKTVVIRSKDKDKDSIPTNLPINAKVQWHDLPLVSY